MHGMGNVRSSSSLIEINLSLLKELPWVSTVYRVPSLNLPFAPNAQLWPWPSALLRRGPLVKPCDNDEGGGRCAPHSGRSKLSIMDFN
jgi:hypothetical protein